jgi:hypothetical protein
MDATELSFGSGDFSLRFIHQDYLISPTYPTQFLMGSSSAASALAHASTSDASGSTSSTWAICRSHSIRNRCHSRAQREDFCTYPQSTPTN